MSLNHIAYCLYLPVTFFITWFVGKDLHEKGAYYITDCFPDDAHLVKTVNSFLLSGYYLLNLGYAAVAVSTFQTIYNTIELIDELLLRTGFIMFSLGIIHYFNLIILVGLKEQIRKIFSQSKPHKI